MSTVTTKNFKVRLQFAKYIVECMGIDEVRHYKKSLVETLHKQYMNMDVWIVMTMIYIKL